MYVFQFILINFLIICPDSFVKYNLVQLPLFPISQVFLWIPELVAQTRHVITDMTFLTDFYCFVQNTQIEILDIQMQTDTRGKSLHLK